MFSSSIMWLMLGIVAMLMISALTGRKLEIRRDRIIFWPRRNH